LEAGRGGDELRSMFENDFVFFPAALPMHWVLYVVDVKQWKIYFVDSLFGEVDEKILSQITLLLNTVHAQLPQNTSSLAEPAWTTVESRPSKQIGGIDCGFHVVLNMDAWASGDFPRDTDPTKMRLFRDRLALSIVKKKYLCNVE
jgi:Ulp1 family protease